MQLELRCDELRVLRLNFGVQDALMGGNALECLHIIFCSKIVWFNLKYSGHLKINPMS